MRYLATGCLSLLLFGAAANAAWLEASSDHFVIYGDQNEQARQLLREIEARIEGGAAAVAAEAASVGAD